MLQHYPETSHLPSPEIYNKYTHFNAITWQSLEGKRDLCTVSDLFLLNIIREEEGEEGCVGKIP